MLKCQEWEKLRCATVFKYNDKPALLIDFALILSSFKWPPSVYTFSPFFNDSLISGSKLHIWLVVGLIYEFAAMSHSMWKSPWTNVFMNTGNCEISSRFIKQFLETERLRDEFFLLLFCLGFYRMIQPFISLKIEIIIYKYRTRKPVHKRHEIKHTKYTST